MKRIRHILFLFGGIIVATIVAYFIFKGDADLYMQAIPQDARAIAKIDFKNFVMDSKLNTVEKLQIVKAWFKDENVANSGLDLERPIYGFMSGKGHPALVASVQNQDNFSNCIEAWVNEGICTPIMRRNGYSWSQINKRYILAYDGKKAMIMGTLDTHNQAAIEAEMLSLLNQEGDRSAIQTPMFKLLRETTQSMACIMNFDMVPLKLRSITGSYLKVHNPNDLLLKLTLEANDNRIDVDAKFITEKTSIKEQFTAMEKTFRRINGNFIPKTCEKHAIWACFNTNGNDLLTFLRFNDTVRMGLITLDVMVDAFGAIRSIDGDVMVNATTDSYYSALFVAETSNQDFLNNINSCISKSNGMLHHIEGQTYAMNVGHNYLTFGLHDKYLYVHTPQPRPQILRDEMFGKGHPYLMQRSKDIKDSRFYATIDVPACLSTTIDSIHMPLQKSLLSNLKRIDIRMSKPDSWKLTIRANANYNFSKQMLLPD